MRLAILLVLLGGIAGAQTQGTLPGPAFGNTGFDSNATCTHTTNCINFPEPIQIGNEVAGCVQWGNAGSGPSSITDSLGNTATLETAYSYGIGFGNDRPFHLQMYHYNSGFAGTGWIIITGGSDMYSKNVGVIPGASDTKDGSLVTNNASPASPMGSVTNSVTSTVNGDIAASCLGNTQGGSSVLAIGGGGIIASDNANPPSVQLDYQNLGLLGGYSIVGNLINSNGSDTVAINTLLLKPSTTIFLSDTGIPQAADGVTYKAQLHVVGGISTTLTYACSGLPSNGLSLTSSTGVISGTPSGIATLSLGCTVSDGTNTSATDNLSLQVGASFGTISLGTPVSGGLPNGGGSLPVLSVTCGDVVLLCTTQGDDTHGSSGWIQSLSGSGNRYSDSLNSPVQRYPMFGGTRNGPTSCVAFGPVVLSGADTITVVNNQSAASGLSGWAIPIHNAQSILDVGSFANAITSTTNPTASVSFTTPVANEEAVAIGTIACATAGCSFLNTDTVSFGAPFTTSFQTSGQQYVMSGFATAPVATASSVTATATFNGVVPTNGNDDSMMLVALRPALPFTGCQAPVFPGEKVRRQIY